jgi:hypothetical protein
MFNYSYYSKRLLHQLRKDNNKYADFLINMVEAEIIFYKKSQPFNSRILKNAYWRLDNLKLFKRRIDLYYDILEEE